MTSADLSLRWRIDALSQALSDASAALGDPHALPVHVEARAEVDSTNTRLLAHARHDAQPWLRLLVAERQTAGRGRQGRPWHSAAGESLTFSMSMPMPQAMDSSVSLALGAALAEALDPRRSDEETTATAWRPQLMLKWPNDLWLRDDAAVMGGRKLAGVLIETTSTPWGRALVIGVGVNLRPPSQPPMPAPPYGLASLVELHAPLRAAGAPQAADDAIADAATALHILAPALLHAMHQDATADPPPWVDRWQRRDVLRGRRVQTDGGGTRVTGLACGVRSDGALLVQDDDGTLHALTSGEVSVRPA